MTKYIDTCNNEGGYLIPEEYTDIIKLILENKLSISRSDKLMIITKSDGQVLILNYELSIDESVERIKNWINNESL